MAAPNSLGLPHVVVLGGGNGTSRLLQALVPLLTQGNLASLHALVHMSDDGGSTGRLREQYDVAAMGDLTKCLMALSSYAGDIRGDEFLRALEYRFTSGDFQGHTLRNMMLTALEKTSDIDAAIATMARILQVPKYAGVVPTTLTTLTEQVVIKLNGSSNLLGEGEHSIAHKVNLQADPHWKPGDVKVVFAEGDVPLNPRAQEVLAAATHIIIAPGHTYGTILPTIALPALKQVVAQSTAELYVVMTLLTTPHQTTGWSGEDFVHVYESYLGRSINAVIANTGTIALELVPGQEWVRFTETEHPYQLITTEIVSTETATLQPGDTVPRAIVVHDTDKLRTLLAERLK
jgi:uncharacterized cofD-like protein